MDEEVLAEKTLVTAIPSASKPHHQLKATETNDGARGP